MQHNQQLHFIIGAPRSGTTILSKLLNNHSSIHCLPEANFLIFFLHKFRNKESFSIADINLIFEQIHLYSLTHPWVGWEFDIEIVKKLICTAYAEKKITYIELCKIIYQYFKTPGMNKEESDILLDKNPIYTLFSEKIKKTIPTAKFILIIRDYRAHVLSRKQSIDFAIPDIAFNALRWKLFNKTAFRFYKNYPSDVLLIKYEELISQKEIELTKICDFLKIPQEKGIFENNIKDKTDLSGLEVPLQLKKRLVKKYADLDKPVNSDRVSAWKTELTKEEIMLCDAICGNFSKKLGYYVCFQIAGISSFLLKSKSITSLLKAFIDIKKEALIYYVSPQIKLNRLKNLYYKTGFLKRQEF